MRIITLLTLLIFALPLPAQKLKYRIEHFGAEVALSQGSVFSIFKDSNVHMWFGTRDGLNLWNGKTLKVFLSSAKFKFSF
jgi:hypothetical protein